MLRPRRAALTRLFSTASPVGSASGALADQRPQRTERTGEVAVIAHRGASAYRPENTLPAVALGADMCADYVEIDVQMTSDGRLVVMHDAALTRTTDVETRYPDHGPWNVGNLTLEESRALDAGSWFGEAFAGTGVPTLQEVLATLHGRAGLLLEVKSPHRYPGIAEAIVAELAGEGWLPADTGAGRLVVQSFDWEFMAYFKGLAPQVPAGLLGGPPSEAQMAGLSTWADQINPSHPRVTAAFVARVHRYGMTTWPYTVNNAGRMRQLLDLGVDGIITNHPDVLVEVARENRGERPAA
jgi:glycerophosphoryl diester phosphodiesterase